MFFSKWADDLLNIRVKLNCKRQSNVNFGFIILVHIDISRVFNNVLPQQTQPTDSFSGEKTITSNYTQWYLEVLLRRVSAGHIVYSPNHKAFVSLTTEGQLPFSAEEYADLMGM